MDEPSPTIRWATATLVVACVAVLIILVARPSEAQRIADEVNAVRVNYGTQSGNYDHLLPTDLARPCTGFESEADFAPSIDGRETTARGCGGRSGLAISELSYQGIVWGYILATGDNTVVIVDTDADGIHDLLYPQREPVYMPAWAALRAAGNVGN